MLDCYNRIAHAALTAAMNFSRASLCSLSMQAVAILVVILLPAGILLSTGCYPTLVATQQMYPPKPWVEYHRPSVAFRVLLAEPGNHAPNEG